MFKPDKYLAKENLQDGLHYRGCCRNTSVARWCRVNEYLTFFVYWRTKFGDRFLEEIAHPDDDPHYDVFYAIEVTEPTEEYVVSDEIIREYYSA